MKTAREKLSSTLVCQGTHTHTYSHAPTRTQKADRGADNAKKQRQRQTPTQRQRESEEGKETRVRREEASSVGKSPGWKRRRPAEIQREKHQEEPVRQRHPWSNRDPRQSKGEGRQRDGDQEKDRGGRGDGGPSSTPSPAPGLDTPFFSPGQEITRRPRQALQAGG